VRAMIRESKTHQIQSALQTGRKYGMQTLDEAIFTHLKSGRISATEAYMKCVDKEKFRTYLTEPPPDFTEV
jgi:twitching motility protein PilT